MGHIALDPVAVAIAELRRSPKFLAWRPVDFEEKQTPDGAQLACEFSEEKHYTPQALAGLWEVSAETIRNVFRNEPGVLRIAHPNGKKRKYVLMRIPESVAERVHRRLSAVPA
jgi:hypothetical protein